MFYIEVLIKIFFNNKYHDLVYLLCNMINEKYFEYLLLKNMRYIISNTKSNKVEYIMENTELLPDKYYKIEKSNSITYFKNNERHNSNGPAYIEYYNSGIVKYEIYYIDGVKHRNISEGPAMIKYHKNGSKKESQYYTNGKFIRNIEHR